ncbi:hypothetical protein [Corynebacterium sp. 335C]
MERASRVPPASSMTQASSPCSTAGAATTAAASVVARGSSPTARCSPSWSSWRPRASPLHVTAARDIICHRATDGALDRLGLPGRGDADYTSRMAQSRWYDRAWNAIHRILDPIDL